MRAMMSLGREAMPSFPRKQKLNVRSSTEGELVGADEALSLLLWGEYFIDVQGYTVHHNKLYQDNKSTMLLEMNGRMPSGRRTKHINARYFMVADRVAIGEAEVEHFQPSSLL